MKKEQLLCLNGLIKIENCIKKIVEAIYVMATQSYFFSPDHARMLNVRTDSVIVTCTLGWSDFEK